MADVQFEGRKYQFPDGMSDKEMLDLVQQERNARVQERAELQAPPKVTDERLVVSPEEQLERDKIAAGIRLKEAGGQAGVASRVNELREMLQVRPMNGSARQILQRELKFWELAQEIEE